jgi:hypothetical protein
VINHKLYLLRRKTIGDPLHEAKHGLLVVIITCWSIFGEARVFLGFYSLVFWRVWRVVPLYQLVISWEHVLNFISYLYI